MNVLLVNKFFYPRAGAETAFFHTRDLLLARGERVIDFAMEDQRNLPSAYASHFAAARSYDAGGGRVRRISDALNAVYSVSARRSLGRLLDRERPDVAHLHNVYHQLTLSVVDELHARGIPIVQTLHDYKIACPSYNLFTDGAPCHRCPNGTVANAIVHRCIKGSIPASALAAVEAAAARRRRTYQRIAMYVAPSRFVASVAIEAGMPAERVRLLPYFLPDDELAVDGAEAREPIFFFGGRLDVTKGVREMLAAFEVVPPPAVLRIAGWGPLEDEVAAAAARNPRIEYLGACQRSEVLRQLGRSRAMLLPSIWEDNCPLVMLEARARSTPVIASDRGGPPEFVEDGRDGFVVDPTDRHLLADRIKTLADDEQRAAAFGRRGRERLLAGHRSDEHYARLMQVYQDARAA
jgi:glycosyltransferase involved in cell wall biosynthesis